jgi:ATP sulfurylase
LTASTSHLIPPHGGELVDLIASPERSAELKAQSREYPSWDLTARQSCDLELLLSGGFSPLRGFMTRADYEGVCQNMRLKSGVLWPMPITLDVTEAFAKTLKPGSSKIALRDAEGVMLAVLSVEDVWQPDRKAEAQAVFHSTSAAHPGVRGSAAACALRLPGVAADASGIACRVRSFGMAPLSRLSDPQPHASRPRRVGLPRR